MTRTAHARPLPPVDLRVEHLDEPLGVGVARPRLSWRLPHSSPPQDAYEIRIGDWSSARIDGSDGILVPYPGPPLASSTRVDWRVRVWSGPSVSDWSQPARFETGLLAGEDWIARFVESPQQPVDEATSRPAAQAFAASYAARTVAPVRARIYATAHGLYELFVNGVRVGDRELTPGFTSYASTLHYQTFDVTALIEPGVPIELLAIVSEGWYRGQHGYLRRTGIYGDRLALLCQLLIVEPDGTREVNGSGVGWLCGRSVVRAADLMRGEYVDFCAHTDTWHDVVVVDHDLARLQASPAPPVRRIESIAANSVTPIAGGRQIVDFGQTINGWIRLDDLGPAGTDITLTYGESLDADGDVTVDHLLAVGDDAFEALYDLSHLSEPFQEDRVVTDGDPGRSFEPRHTTHGFRYVRIDGHPGGLAERDVTGVVVHSAMRRTGWFECSDDRLNRLHEAAVWSFRGNACDIPTDCPTRERQGWTGDWQIFVPTAAFLFDVAGFSIKWLNDLASEQLASGVVQHCAPDPQRTTAESPLNPFPPGSAGWGDAAVIVPWELYVAYGDRKLLANQWASMEAWVGYGLRCARERRHAQRTARRAPPQAHERFVWDTGRHWGEWLEPGDTLGDDVAAFLSQQAALDPADVATAYLFRSTLLLSRIADLLGRPELASRYRRTAAAVRNAWRIECLEPSGAVTRRTQAAHVRALAFDLVRRRDRARNAAQLAELVGQAGDHLTTGFLSTPFLLPVLADCGHADAAYRLLLQDTQPSWLSMIDRGATTIWEAWDGIDADGCAHGSLNHYSKGSVVSFLHTHVAGIRPPLQPAYRVVEIAPVPGGGLTWARARHDSPFGTIDAAWTLDAGRFELRASLPPGVEAALRLPDGSQTAVGPGAHTVWCTL